MRRKPRSSYNLHLSMIVVVDKLNYKRTSPNLSNLAFCVHIVDKKIGKKITKKIQSPNFFLNWA